MKTDIPFKSFVVLIVVALLAGMAGSYVGNRYFPVGVTDEGTGQVVQPVELRLVNEDSRVIEAIQKVSKSVVSIVITQEVRNINQGMSPFDFFFPRDQFRQEFFGPQGQVQPAPQAETEEGEVPMQKVGGGSGFVFSKDGMILTNRHVVARDDVEYHVVLNDGSEYKAEVVSRDIFNDIAVIKLVPEEGAEMPKLHPVTFDESSSLRIGQRVIAIGNALAEFENSATLGIVSAKERQIMASDGNGQGQNLAGLIQTDAAINPGNSGGPLINLAGEVIGINTAIAANANGIGFAIPIDDVLPVIDSIEKHGRIVRPILGVMFTMLTPELAKEMKIDIDRGALLKGDGTNFAVLPGKPAEKAGLREKDVILEVDRVEINEDHPLQREIMKHSPGDTVKIKYYRDGKEEFADVVLEEADFEKKQ